jgi:hypothetical protein
MSLRGHQERGRFAYLDFDSEDGGWEAGWVYKYSSGVKFGNRGLTTALTVQAIAELGQQKDIYYPLSIDDSVPPLSRSAELLDTRWTKEKPAHRRFNELNKSHHFEG